MMQHQIPSVFDESARSLPSPWEIRAAWLVIIVLLAATVMGLALDRLAELVSRI